MTIDNEILLSKQEKMFKESVDLLREELNLNTDISKLNEAECLNLKYSKVGELLREFDYNTALNEILKSGVSTLEEANCLAYILKSNPENILESKTVFYNSISEARTLIENALNNIENNNLSGYEVLLNAYVPLAKKDEKNIFDESFTLLTYDPDRLIINRATEINSYSIGGLLGGVVSGFGVPKLVEKIKAYINNDPEGKRIYSSLKSEWAQCNKKPNQRVKELRKEFISYLKRISKKQLKQLTENYETLTLNNDILTEGVLKKLFSKFKSKRKIKAPRRVAIKGRLDPQFEMFLRNNGFYYLADFCKFDAITIATALTYLGTFESNGDFNTAPATALEFFFHYYEGDKENEIYDLIVDGIYDEINGVEGNKRFNQQAATLYTKVLSEMIPYVKSVRGKMDRDFKTNKDINVNFKDYASIIHPFYVKLENYVNTLESPDNLGRTSIDRIYNERKAAGVLEYQLKESENLEEDYSEILEEGLGTSLMLRCLSKFNDKQCNKILNSISRKVRTEDEKKIISEVLTQPLEEKKKFIRETFNKNKEKYPKKAEEAEKQLESKKAEQLTEGLKLNLQIAGLALVDLALSIFIIFFTSIPFIILPVFSLTAISKARKFKKEHGYSADSIRDLKD